MISGFTIIRNGNRFDFPYLESLRSLAPLVDEIVVGVGNSQDGTRQSLMKLAPELPCVLRLFDSPWDPKQQSGGLELSRQSNIALSYCQNDLCFYLQADEVLHEEDYEIIRRDAERFRSDENVDVLAFHWQHFYGNYKTLAHSKQWYRFEARLIKRSKRLQSFGDAQGFRIKTESGEWEKANGALSQARVFHYGWVRKPEEQIEKKNDFEKLWHGNQAKTLDSKKDPVYHYQLGLKEYEASHPLVMQERIAKYGVYDPFSGKKFKKDRHYWEIWLNEKIEKLTGKRLGEHSNYSSLIPY